MNSKEIRGLQESYLGVYENQNLEDVISEGETPMGQHPGKSTDKVTRDKYETQSRRATAPKGVGVPSKSTGYGGLKDDVDLFDIVKGHLIGEGFAETEESAVAIMSNMSEEWRQSILEAEVLAMKKGVPGSVKVKPALSIPGTSIGVGPNRPVPGTFTTTTPEQRSKIKSGNTHIDRGIYQQPRKGAGPTSNERSRYNSELTRQNKHSAPRMKR
jgi:hypothetical protein